LIAPSRRQFIQVGLAGSAILVAARLLDRPAAAPAGTYRVLDARSAGVVTALAPAVLAGALPVTPGERGSAIREVVEAFDRAVSGLGPAVQGEIDELLALLRYAPTRIALTGLWSSWEDASPEAVAAFLARWRQSPFELPRAGYQALTQLLQAAWYGNARAWPAIGYPGPPELTVNPVAQRGPRAP
jgi:hypothetical protein